MWEYVSALECAWVTAEGADAAVHGEGPLVFVWQHQAGHGGADFIGAAREAQWSVDCLTRMPFSPRAQRISLWNSFQPTEYWTLPFLSLIRWQRHIPTTSMPRRSVCVHVKKAWAAEEGPQHLNTTELPLAAAFARQRPFDPKCQRFQLAKTSHPPLFISVPFNFPPRSCFDVAAAFQMGIFKPPF